MPETKSIKWGVERFSLTPEQGKMVTDLLRINGNDPMTVFDIVWHEPIFVQHRAQAPMLLRMISHLSEPQPKPTYFIEEIT